MLFAKLFSPSKCLFCNKYSLQDICSNCLDTSKLIYEPFCIVCHTKSFEGQTHYKCKKRYTPSKLIVPYEFTGVAKFAIVKSKYSQNSFILSKALLNYSYTFFEQLNYHTLNNYTVIPVPGSPDRVAKRGFNLPDLIAKNLSNKLNLNYSKNLKKVNSVKPFYTLNKKQRTLLIKGSFKVSGRVPSKVILVDDILTSGATLLEAARVCKKSGAKDVVCFALTYKPLR